MSQTVTNPEKSYCRYCEKELHGRQGKIFCNVDCKNNYNSRIRSKLRSEETKLFPEVIKTIKQNYRILLRYQLDKLEEGKEIHIKKTELRQLGFDHRYCTGAAIENDRKLWKCCFAFCWHEEASWITFRYDPKLNTRYNY